MENLQSINSGHNISHQKVKNGKKYPKFVNKTHLDQFSNANLFLWDKFGEFVFME